MSVIIDILGAIIIAGLLLLMLMGFQFHVTETAQRHIFASSMVHHMENAGSTLNHVIGMAGLGVGKPEEAVASAGTSSFVFRSYWDFHNNSIGNIAGQPNYISISLRNSPEGTGKAIELRQGNSTNIATHTILEDMGYIFWVDDLKFVYFDIHGSSTKDIKKIRSVDVRMTFRRGGPFIDTRDLTNKLQVKCYLMNTYLQEGVK